MSVTRVYTCAGCEREARFRLELTCSCRLRPRYACARHLAQQITLLSARDDSHRDSETLYVRPLAKVAA